MHDTSGNHADNVGPEPRTELTLAEFQAIVAQANAGDAEALDTLRRVLAETPTVWQRVGDIAQHTERVIIATIAGGDRLVEESLRHKVEQVRCQLLNDDDSPLIRIAVERTVAAWLQVQFCERFLLTAEAGLPEARFWLQRLALADRMHRSGMKDLAMLRQLERRQHSTSQRPAFRVVS